MTSPSHPAEANAMYRLQMHWANCSTQTLYLCSIATWTDAVKDVFFTWGEKSSDAHTGAQGQIKQELVDQLRHPFMVGSVPWVIRSHRFLFHTQREYHACTDYRSDLAVRTSVTRVGRSSLDVEHFFYHDLHGDLSKAPLLVQTRSSVIVVSPDDHRPAPHGLDAHSSACATESFSIPTEFEKRPEHTSQYSLLTRPSDADGHGHVNNAVLISFIQNARLMELMGGQSGGLKWKVADELENALQDIQSMYIEFLDSALPNEELTVLSWYKMKESAQPSSKSDTAFFDICRAGGEVIARARMDFGTVPPRRASAL